MKEQQQTAVQNFLASLDMEMPMVDHFRNAMRDARIYKWSSSMVIKIMAGIEDAYKKKEKI